MTPRRRLTSRLPSDDTAYAQESASQNSKHPRRGGSWRDCIKEKIHKWSGPKSESKSGGTFSDLHNASMPSTLQRTRSNTDSHNPNTSQERTPSRHRTISNMDGAYHHYSHAHGYHQDAPPQGKITVIRFTETPSRDDIQQMAEEISRQVNAERPWGSGPVDLIVVDPTGDGSTWGSTEADSAAHARRPRVYDRSDRASESVWGGKGHDRRQPRYADPAALSQGEVRRREAPLSVATTSPPYSMPPTSQYTPTESAMSAPGRASDTVHSPAPRPAFQSHHPSTASPEQANTSTGTGASLSDEEMTILMQWVAEQDPASTRSANKQGPPATYSVPPTLTSIAAH